MKRLSLMAAIWAACAPAQASQLVILSDCREDAAHFSYHRIEADVVVSPVAASCVIEERTVELSFSVSDCSIQRWLYRLEVSGEVQAEAIEPETCEGTLFFPQFGSVSVTADSVVICDSNPGPQNVVQMPGGIRTFRYALSCMESQIQRAANQ